ncbi:uncharacterized protein LOC113449679 [Pseudonaja textilis]|uniref:uncharacterized protein LOC113449679 n=1 Tax=Pseudonaja textilis TaxID=8673 RepID=UPI000EA97DBD|nr:uncharacterized protein LOC113449679 [Pseudonaja textilis]
MDANQTIASAIKKPKKRGVKNKKKRLTFQDEAQPEEELLLKESKHLVTAKTTTYLTFGFVFIKSLPYHNLDIVGATYNNRSKKLVLIDGRGFFSLDLLPSNCTAKREMYFPKYQFNLARIITYSEKYNVYFVLQKDFAIKVYNKNYAEICSIDNPGLGRMTYISFNPVKEELISGGITGVKTWKFKEKKHPLDFNPIPMYNYSLFLSTEYPHMGKKWCTNMDFDITLQRYYCFSGGHFFCYDINGKLLLEILNAHERSIISCVYSSNLNILLTASKGNEIKSWNDQGCLLHVFQGHSKTVTKLLLHPNTTSLFISGSLDGSVKLWSFDSMDSFYSLSLFQEGILSIGTMEDKFLYCCSAHNVHIYDLNLFTSFWSHVNSPINHFHICSAVGKSNRVAAMGVDNSLRIFSVQTGKKLCTVLPPPYPPMLQPVLSFTYNRTCGTIYFLLTPYDIWIYTAKTDPACRAAVWTTRELQEHLHRKHPLASCIEKNGYFQHTQKRNFRTSAKCECLCSLSSSLCYLADEGMIYADNQEFLVLGMQDGRILFLHTSVQNLVYYEMATYEDPVIHLQHDIIHHQLVIMCQKPKYKLIHYRSLPALELVFQVYLPNDATVFTRLDRSLFIGLKSGIVDILSILEESNEVAFPEKEKIEEKNLPATYHEGPVISVDSCKTLSVFLSCGSDAAIKLWNIYKDLIAEIRLDNTLSTACFLNNSGDILLAFKNDIYILYHSKMLHFLRTSIQTAKVIETESYIFESQLLDYHYKTDAPKSIEMASYLVPYKGYSFTEDFTSELQVLPEKKGKAFWKIPVAPSMIYLSPCTSEVSLKMFDFLLQAGTHDLEEQDKAKMYERMIVTKDMKYMPERKPATPARLEIPFFGVSPSPSLIQEPLEATKQEEEQFSRKKTEQCSEGYKSTNEKDIRVVFLRKENEAIQQKEEQSLTPEFEKRSFSHRYCFTPNNSLQYQTLEYPNIVSESFFAMMKPFKQYQRHPYTVMEETTINLPRDFPYRLAWGTPTSQDLKIKLYHPKLKLRKEQGASKVVQEKTLQPTRSIPDKGRYILVNDPNSAPSVPPMSLLESRLLSARFPVQKEKILRSLF